MRICTAASIAIAALCLGVAPALAFEQGQAIAPEPAPQMLPEATKPPMLLGSPDSKPDETVDRRKGRIFGILPRLNFGLELMYGEQKHAEDKDAIKIDDESDVGFLGKLKRLF